MADERLRFPTPPLRNAACDGYWDRLPSSWVWRKERGGVTVPTFYGRSSIDRGDGGVANFKPPGVTSQHIKVEGLAMELAQIERERRAR